MIEKKLILIVSIIEKLRKFNKKNSILFIINWLKIELNYEKFKNKIIIKKSNF